MCGEAHVRYAVAVLWVWIDGTVVEFITKGGEVTTGTRAGAG